MSLVIDGSMKLDCRLNKGIYVLRDTEDINEFYLRLIIEKNKDIMLHYNIKHEIWSNELPQPKSLVFMDCTNAWDHEIEKSLDIASHLANSGSIVVYNMLYNRHKNFIQDEFSYATIIIPNFQLLVLDEWKG